MELVSEYSGQIYNVTVIWELRDGRIFHGTRQYDETFEVPEWRAHWVEQME